MEKIFNACPFLTPHILFYNNNDLVIRHTKVDNDHKSALLNFIKVKIFRAYSPLKPFILFYNNGLTKLYDFPEITHFEVYNCHMSAILNSIVKKFSRHIPP